MFGYPAFLYSSPYFNMRSQKCGTCQIKKKKASISALGSVNSPPPATHPTKGGKEPITDPGITAKAVFLYHHLKWIQFSPSQNKSGKFPLLHLQY